MINRIEQALIERLKLGLGKMVQDVDGYAGELDDEALALRRLPVALVSYGGSTFKPVTMGLRGARIETTDTFVVVVLTRSYRSSLAGFRGSVHAQEVGVNRLVEAVKYLLTNQTLGALVAPLKPLRVRSLWNNQQVRQEKLSAYAIEFEVKHTEQIALADGRFPEGSDDINHPEYLFKQHFGKLSEPEPDLLCISGEIKDNAYQTAFAVEVKNESESR